MSELRKVEVRCTCGGKVRRSGQFIICEDRECRSKFRPRDARMVCPAEGCSETAVVSPGLTTGHWEPRPGTRGGKDWQGDMFVVCMKGHRTRVERPQVMAPTQKVRKARGFY